MLVLAVCPDSSSKVGILALSSQKLCNSKPLRNSELLIFLRSVYLFFGRCNTVLGVFQMSITIIIALTRASMIDYVKIMNNPGTEEICLMVHKTMSFVSLPQACPNTCERKMMRNTQIVAQYDSRTGRCDCYNASAVCDIQPAKSDDRFLFYIQGQSCFIMLTLWPSTFLQF